MIFNKRSKNAINPLAYLFVFFLTILMIACKQEGADGSHLQSAEEGWREDYTEPPYIWGFIDTTGTYRIKPVYDDLRDFSGTLAAANLKGKWGFIDQQGKMVINFQFLTCGDFSEGLALVQDFNKKYMYVDTNGKTLLKCPGEECRDYRNGFAFYQLNGSFGVLDKSGSPIIAPRFQDIRYGESEQFVARLGDREGVLDVKGNWVIPAENDKIKPAGEGYYLVKKGSGYTYIHKSGKATNTAYEHGGAFERGFAVVKKSGQYFLIDKNLKEAYTSLSKLTSAGEGKWIEWETDTTGVLVDHTGKKVGNKAYNAFLKFSEGVIGVMEQSVWGYADTEGTEVVSPALPLIWDCSGGRIRFISQSGYGYLDRAGRVKIIPKFVEARDFKSGVARAAIFR